MNLVSKLRRFWERWVCPSALITSDWAQTQNLYSFPRPRSDETLNKVKLEFRFDALEFVPYFPATLLWLNIFQRLIMFLLIQLYLSDSWFHHYFVTFSLYYCDALLKIKKQSLKSRSCSAEIITKNHHVMILKVCERLLCVYLWYLRNILLI